MLFGQDRNQLRQVFFEAWRKHQNRQPLEPLEQLLAQVIARHPEYHALLENPATALEQDFSAELGQSNPFLHMALHIAILEQVSINQPAGIAPLYRQLLQKYPDAHAAEHKMMECLAEMIWQAQRNNTLPDENLYLECVKKL